jgi:hypothetical protein
MQEAELRAVAANEEDVSVAFREHARAWTKTEFDAHLAKLLAQKKIDEAELYQLPHDGVLVRYDILQFAHAMRLREHLAGTDAPLVLVMDDDKGLRQALCSIFAPEVKAGRAEIAIVSFDKGMTNDMRNQVVADGQNALAATRIIGLDLRQAFQYPFPRKSEPNRRIRLLTDSPVHDYRQKARLLRLATLRSVDSYFHKFRSNVRFAARPSISAGSVKQTWDRQYLYKPATMAKLVEIYRFYHNWCELGADKKTPAMRLGLARGRIYERDFM